jgi:hypothetical protein
MFNVILNFGYLDFGFDSNFDIRVSDFRNNLSRHAVIRNDVYVISRSWHRMLHPKGKGSLLVAHFSRDLHEAWS